MQKIALIILFALVLTACQVATPALTPTDTPASLATFTSTFISTFTPIPLVDLEGSLFFDYNGSGLREDGEPPIENFGVCVKAKDICVNTDENGHFIFEKVAPEGTGVQLSFVDPDANIPSLAFRFINIWKANVVIPAYEIDGIQVPEQHLIDNDVVPLAKGLRTVAGNNDSIGLMQGFLTLPLPPSALDNYHHVLGYDHDPRKGFVVNYAGDTFRCPESPLCNPIDPTLLITELSRFAGVYDSHVGYDFMFPKNSDKYFFMAAIPGVVDIWVSNGLVLAIKETDLGFEMGPDVTNGEIYKALVAQDQKVYRGQIIGLTGSASYFAEHPELPWFIYPNGSNYEITLLLGPRDPPEPDDYKPNSYEKDPYGVTDPNVPMNFPELEVYSSWTVFNSPQQPLVSWSEK